MVLAIKLDPPLPLALQDVTWTVPPFPLARRGDVDGTAIATGDTGHVGEGLAFCSGEICEKKVSPSLVARYMVHHVKKLSPGSQICSV